MISSFTGGSLVRKRKREGEMWEWGAASLWLLFGHSSSHAALTTDRAWQREARQGIWGGGVSGGDGYRGKVRAHCILSLHVDSGQEGGWSLESVTEKKKEKELEWVGFCPCSLALCSQPGSCARWSNERPGASDKLGPDGERILPHNYSAAESIRASAASSLWRKDNHWVF